MWQTHRNVVLAWPEEVIEVQKGKLACPQAVRRHQIVQEQLTGMQTASYRL